MNTEFYHVTWNGWNGANPCYYVEGTKENGRILATRFQVTSIIRNGKRVKAKLEPVYHGGAFPLTCKIRKLKKNPFKD